MLWNKGECYSEKNKSNFFLVQERGPMIIKGRATLGEMDMKDPVTCQHCVKYLTPLGLEVPADVVPMLLVQHQHVGGLSERIL